MDNTLWQKLLEPEVLGILFALVCVIIVVVALMTIGIVRMIHKHRERIAMIEQGIHPDYPPEDGDVK